MTLITKEIALLMESCIKQTHIEFTKQNKQGLILEVNGGAACFSGYDSFFSQVVGWGFFSKVPHFKEELLAIENFYKSLGQRRVDIELCPFVGNDLAEFLSQRAYQITELNHVSLLNLESIFVVDSPDFLIKIVPLEEWMYWAKMVAIGFGYPGAEDQFVQYAQSKGVIAFAVYNKEQIIAGATLAMHAEVCDLGVTSTLPQWRNKGLQKMLLQARLQYAKQQGLLWATVTTEPGSISDLNVQKCGFRCAYTRIKMTKEIR